MVRRWPPGAHEPEDPSQREADAEAEQQDPDPQHAGPAEATDDVEDTRPPTSVEDEPGELPPELPDPS